MSISPEELAAFADGQLEGEAKARVAAAVAADPELARKVEAHLALSARLSAHYAPVLDQPLPDRLTNLLADKDQAGSEAPGGVIDLAAVRERQESRRRLPGWGWGGGAIAAALVAALALSTGDEASRTGHVGAQLASALDTQLVAEQRPGADTRILLSFRNREGQFCRAYSQADTSGIACKDAGGWRQQEIAPGSSGGQGEFRMAASEAEIMAAAQELAVGPALSAREEAAAQAAGWSE